MLNSFRKTHAQKYSILITTLLLTACSHNVNLSQDIPYINHPAKLSHAMYIKESSDWLWGNNLELRNLEKQTYCDYLGDDNICFTAANYFKNPALYQTWHSSPLSRKVRIMGIIPRGTPFVINEIYQPQIMSDGVTYLRVTILSGQFRGLKIVSFQDDDLKNDVIRY